ncbi:MAG: type II/IV secretion system ATPase subunit [Candidatus Altiarchaeia archaeon]
MSKDEIKVSLSGTLEEATARNPHLKRYLENLAAKGSIPEFHTRLERGMKDLPRPNIIYPVGDPVFIHIYKEHEGDTRYEAIQPELSDSENKLYEQLTNKLIEIAHTQPVPREKEGIEKILSKLFDQIVEISETSHISQEVKKKGVLSQFTNNAESKIKVTKEEYEKLKYFLLRDRVGYGVLEPLLRDPYIEDIHCTGVGNVHLIHKIFEMQTTNIKFTDDLQLDRYVFHEAERVERPLSEAQPVVDAIMPDGSRVNFIYGREMSLEGSSFTIRKFTKIPISITQLVFWKTFNSKVAAYLWLCLQYGVSIFICGETASGKTTTLNAAAAFIKPEGKVYSVENTPEVTIPHEVWQHLVTRESGKKTDVTMFDLLIAALRSRPDYIVVGEIRSTEGNVAFQAMQTGHPVISTFHAGSVTSMIQRLTGHPINVPIASIDNLNIVLIQQPVYYHGRFVRRVLDITEIEHYYDDLKKVSTRSVFGWVPATDEHVFRGWHNSYVLEKKIAVLLGYEDPREIYEELEKRARIIDAMVENKIFNYFDVWNVIKGYVHTGKVPFNY